MRKVIAGILLIALVASILVQSKIGASTMYYSTVKTSPLGITTIGGEGWYTDGAVVSLVAPETVNEYQFVYWDVNGVMMPANPIFITMNQNHTATAHYREKDP